MKTRDLALLLLASACGSSSSTMKEPTVEDAGRAQRFQIGNLEAYALEDAHLDVPNDAQLLGVGHSPTEIGDVLAAAGLPRETIGLDIHPLLVKAGDRVILFDTGTGTGALQSSLALAGVKPVGVTDIFISHAHSDHVGGLATKTGALAFPSATIRMSAPEWASLQANTDEESKQLVVAIRDKVEPFDPNAQVLPVVKAVATHGHTPGHSSFEIGTDDDKLFYLGDVAHHFVISVQRPSWPIVVDGEGAIDVRQQTLAKLAADHTRVFAFHFPFPGVGHVVARGNELVFMATR